MSVDSTGNVDGIVRMTIQLVQAPLYAFSTFVAIGASVRGIHRREEVIALRLIACGLAAAAVRRMFALYWMDEGISLFETSVFLKILDQALIATAVPAFMAAGILVWTRKVRTSA